MPAVAFNPLTGNFDLTVNHNLLSALHPDTLAASVVRGDVLIGNSTPKWSRLAIGSSGKVLTSDGTDVSWQPPSTGITIGTTTIASGSSGRVLYDNAGVVGEMTTTGSGTVLALATSPVLVTPTLGVAVATTLNGNTFTTGTYTLTGVAGKTLTFNKSLTLDGTDSTTMTFPTTSATIARTDAAQTFTGSQTIAALVGPVTITEAVGSSALTLTGATQTSSFPVLSATQIWNNSGTTFTFWKGNVTNTASAAASLMLDLQVAAASKFWVRSDGLVATSGSGSGVGFLAIVSGQNPVGIARNSSINGLNIFGGGNNATGDAQGVANFGPSQFLLDASVTLAWSASNVTQNADLVLRRDAAQTLAQRNAANAQKLRIYNTFTTIDTAGEWFAIDWITTANVVNLQAVKGSSTGTARVLTVSYGGAQASPVAAITVPITSGPIVFGGGITTEGPVVHAANYMELTEMTAPAAGATNNVRIYAEDNGGGKTRLMALFPTGASQQIAIEP